jgi:hypothetical protein
MKALLIEYPEGGNNFGDIDVEGNNIIKYV